jgi:hypothetical protein
MGLEPQFANKNLVGGSAIITGGLWASKVSSASQDTSGFGTFSITTMQGKYNRGISFISAYIAVDKGTNIGTESLFAQQTTIQVKQALQAKREPPRFFCPRTDAIKCLNKKIKELQDKGHAIILMIDANQSLADCTSKGIKPYSIAWLQVERGMDDPFIQLVGHWPNSTTQTPNREIDFVLTFGINIINISTLEPNIPSYSDHLGLLFDLDIKSFFSSQYSDICKVSPRPLTSGNEASVNQYIKYVTDQFLQHNIPNWVQGIMEYAVANKGPLPCVEASLLNSLDNQITEITLAGERQCEKKCNQCQLCPPPPITPNSKNLLILETKASDGSKKFIQMGPS